MSKNRLKEGKDSRKGAVCRIPEERGQCLDSEVQKYPDSGYPVKFVDKLYVGHEAGDSKSDFKVFVLRN